MTLREEYDRPEYKDEGLCPSCHRPATDTVDHEDGHHFLKCSCGKTRFEYDEEAEPVEAQLCDYCEDGEAVFVVRVHRLHSGGIGEYCDSMRLCADCARDESWHINDKEKLEA